MCAHNRAIHVVGRPVAVTSGIALLLQRREDAVPHPARHPAVDAGGNALPRSVALGQIAPLGTGRVQPEHRSEHLSVVAGRPSTGRLLRG